MKILVFVASEPDFYEQPEVADGATGLLTDLSGEETGAPSRSAVGVTSCPEIPGGDRGYRRNVRGGRNSGGKVKKMTVRISKTNKSNKGNKGIRGI